MKSNFRSQKVGIKAVFFLLVLLCAANASAILQYISLQNPFYEGADCTYGGTWRYYDDNYNEWITDSYPPYILSVNGIASRGHPYDHARITIGQHTIPVTLSVSVKWVPQDSNSTNKPVYYETGMVGYDVTITDYTPLQDQIDPQPEEANTDEPINFISGNNHFSALDAHISAPGIPLTFRRYYNSAETNHSVLGQGWTHSYDWELQAGSNKATVVSGDARTFSFLKYSPGSYSTAIDNNWKLTGQTNGEHTLILPGGFSYLFDTNGILQDVSDDWGNTVSLSYSNQLLTRLEHSNGNALDFTYSNGFLAAVTAATNLSISFQYAPEGVLTQAVRQAGSEPFIETYAYDTSLLLTQKVDEVGSDYHYSYDAATGKATGMYLTDNRWYKHAVTYPSNNLSVVTYENTTNNLSHDYDIDPYSSRILEERFNAVTGRVTFVYDADKNVKRKTTYDADTNQWAQVYRLYDSWHNITDEAFGLSAEPTNITQTTWHPEWQAPTSVTDPEGFETEYEYTNGLIALERIPLSGSETAETIYSYTTNGLLAALINANGHTVSFTYDALGYPESATPQVGPVTTFGYDSLGHLTNSALPGGRETDYTVNPLGWIERIDYADGLYETFEYNGLGKITNRVDRAGRTASYAYAPGGKLTAITRQLGSANVTVSYAFDQQFNTLSITDEMGRPVESYVLDLQDRPTTVTNVEGQTMSIDYLVEDFVGSITRFDGTAVSNEYTGDGRFKAVHYPDETNRFTWLKNGWLKTSENSTGIISNGWNHAGWLTSASASNSVSSVYSVVNYSHDLVGNVTNAVVEIGGSDFVTTAYKYDAAERLKEILTTEGAETQSFAYAYNTNNGLVASVSNSVLHAEYDYDILDRVESIEWKDSFGATILSFDYQYNAAGMITNVVEDDGSQLSVKSYQYDDLDRLTSESFLAGSAPLRETSYSYDHAGNRHTKTGTDYTVNYTLGTGNRLTSWSATSTNDFSDLRTLRVEGYSSETIGTDNRWGELYVSNSVAVTPDISGTNFSIDAFTIGIGTQQIVAAIRDQAGNMGYATNEIFLTMITNGTYQYNAAGCVTDIAYAGTDYNESLSLNWNAQYQLVSVDEVSSLVEYSYDVLERRINRTEGTNVEHYIYSGNHVVADLDETGGLLRTYVYGPGIDNLLSLTTYGAETNTYYALKDRLNTVHALIDASGQIVERYEYDAWGRTTVFDVNGNELMESAFGNRYCFQGREIEWTTGLYYFRSRWYDPVTGRWLSKDPIGISGGLNQYVFCGNNPVNFVDPFGNCPKPGDQFSIFKPGNEPYVTGLEGQSGLGGDQSLHMKIIAHLPFVHEVSQRHDRQTGSLPGPHIIRNVGTLPTAIVETAGAGVGAAVGSVVGAVGSLF